MYYNCIIFVLFLYYKVIMEKLPNFIFNLQEETLIIKHPDGKLEEKTTSWRDKWNNPGFDLEISKKGASWVMFGRWKRKKGTPEAYECVRAFYKRIVEKDTKIKVVYYQQEQKKRDILNFQLEEKDEVEKNENGKWVPKNYS